MQMEVVTRYLLELHESSNEIGYRALQELALKRLAGVVRHDKALLATGTLVGGEPRAHDLLPVGLPRDAFLADWERVKHEDRITRWSARNPGRTGAFPVGVEPADEGAEAIVAHCRRFGIAHLLVTSVVAPDDAGLYWTLLVYRERADDPFSEDERATAEICVPHVFAAARRARLRELRASGLVGAVHGQLAALVSGAGLVLEAEPGFADLVRLGWPSWRGPLLPGELVAELTTADAEEGAEAPDAARRIARANVVLRAHPTDGGWLLHVRRPVAADALTPREREIAEAFSRGDTYRELGERFAVSPHTVRRHLANVYEKLGISSKAELDRMVRGV